MAIDSFLHEKCLKYRCLKILPSGKCLAFTEPKYMWKYDKLCFGYTGDPAVLKNILSDMIAKDPSLEYSNDEKDLKESIKRLEDRL